MKPGDYLFIVVVMLGGMAGMHYLDRAMFPAPETPAAVIDGVKLGRAYAAVLVGTYADAWEVAAATIEAGKPVSDAQAAMQDAWKAARIKVFEADVSPEFAKLLPPGAEPKTTEKAHEIGRAWRDFARGLRGHK